MGASVSLVKRRSLTQKPCIGSIGPCKAEIPEDSPDNSPSSPAKPQPKQETTISEPMDISAIENNEPEPKQLTEEQKELVRGTWQFIEQDAERIGAVTFINLFEMHPGVKEEFIPFKSIDVNDTRYNKILRNHGLKVLNTIGKMVNRLDEKERMITMLQSIGTRHGDYKANAQLIQVMCPHFLKAIENTLSDHWTPEVQAAYELMFHILSYYMKRALIQIQKETGQIK